MSDKEKSFWGKHAEMPNETGISGYDAEWHVVRAPRFAYGLKLSGANSAYLDSYLSGLGRKPVWMDLAEGV